LVEDVQVQPDIPARWEDVEPPWMTKVLAERFPGIEVEALELLMQSDGSNRRARFGISRATGDGPDAVFVKAEGAHRDVHARNGNLFNEPKLYASGVSLAVDHPEPYAVMIDEPELDWLVVMEDVTARGARPRDASQPLTPEPATNGVRGLAGVHQAYWGLSPGTSPPLAWLQTWAPTEGFRSGLAKRIPTGLARAAETLPAEVVDLDADAILALWARYVGLLDRDPVTLLHGDAHIGNTYVLPDDDVGFLDWQVARRGNWSQDVGHFLQGAVVPEDRRAHERTILDEYGGRVDRGLSRDEIWTWYRASAVYGLAIWLSTLGTDGYQPREVSLTLAQRFAHAFVDLDTPTAIAALQ
jgi:hypothetical protein